MITSLLMCLFSGFLYAFVLWLHIELGTVLQEVFEEEYFTCFVRFVFFLRC